MLCFFTYKIGYYIYIIKENNANLLKFIQYTFKGGNENITIDDIITINNTDNNHTIKITEDLLIPTSYSEHLEDLILNIFFYDINKGFYIDIGNFSPNKTSVTKYFYLKGWNGINIKPFNEQYKDLINRRPKDINIYYNIDGKYANKYTFHDFNKNAISFHTISDILHEYIPKNKEIHFCKMDLKNDIRKILLGYDFDNFAPKIFCIENNNTYQSFDYILYKNNYSFIYEYELNRYYINNQFVDLKERVDYIDELINIYKNKINEG